VKKILFLLQILFKEAKQRNFIVKSIIFGLIYLIVALVLFDFKTYESVLSQAYPVLAKLWISLLLFMGSFSILGLRDSLLIVIIALLFGINLELVIRKLKFLKDNGGLHITFGAGILSLIAAGCASCGLSFASVLGIATIVALLPFHGLELYILSILILFISLLYNLHTLVRVCKIKP
jgi:hypothetical protein